MSIPQSWYSYVLPGILFLLSIVPVLGDCDRTELQEFVNSNALGSAVLIGLAGFYVGFSLDALGIQIVGWLKSTPDATSEVNSNLAILYYDDKTDLARVLWDSYQAVVLRRLLCVAFVCLATSSTIGLVIHHDRRFIRLGILLFGLVGAFGMRKSWKKVEAGHGAFTKTANALAATRGKS